MALFNDSLCVCHPLTVGEKVCAFVVNRYGTRPIAVLLGLVTYLELSSRGIVFWPVRV